MLIFVTWKNNRPCVAYCHCVNEGAKPIPYRIILYHTIPYHTVPRLINQSNSKLLFTPCHRGGKLKAISCALPSLLPNPFVSSGLEEFFYCCWSVKVEEEQEMEVWQLMPRCLKPKVRWWELKFFLKSLIVFPLILYCLPGGFLVLSCCSWYGIKRISLKHEGIGLLKYS